MKKDKEIERQVLARYIELAGLVKDGQMINRDKESRAREYVKSRTKVQARVVDQISEGSKIKKNSKYGELIVQANRVQYYLTKLVLLRSLDPSGAFEKELGRLQLGHLIGYLRVCAQTKEDLDLAAQVKAYKDKRDALAHRMFTAKKLTPRGCESAVKSGNKIVKYLIDALKEKPNMLKGSDKVSDFPKQFNKLVRLVKSLEKRLAKLEKSKVQK